MILKVCSLSASWDMKALSKSHRRGTAVALLNDIDRALALFSISDDS